jgi:hypothetical protein
LEWMMLQRTTTRNVKMMAIIVFFPIFLLL